MDDIYSMIMFNKETEMKYLIFQTFNALEKNRNFFNIYIKYTNITNIVNINNVKFYYLIIIS